jgi:two-component system, OmpR family, heavy metal sensor histidine kinase CusS
MNTALRSAGCSHSIGVRLSQKLAVLTMVVLGIVFGAAWFSIKMFVVEKNREDLAFRGQVVGKILQSKARFGGEAACIAQLQADAAMRANSHIEVRTADGRLLFADPTDGAHALSRHVQSHDFTVETPGVGGGRLQVHYTMDFESDARMGRNWAVVLVLLTIVAGAVVGAGAFWHVRRQLRPLADLAAQTRAISPGRLDQRLALSDPAEELLPWVEQFNALMGRLEQAYAQLEGFNADVAHELRTPLATLRGQTELALSRERPAEALRETLISNLEELQRLAALVNDMLFLSQADRGAVARRGDAVSLAALAGQVVEFHEAAIDEAGVQVRVEGDVNVAVDEPLYKRAVSNLLGNAIRFAERGSQIVIRVAPEGGAADHVEVTVSNAGPAIAPQHLARLFDRFFRVDSARADGQSHHGLGLAIVAAIARMHAGRTLAQSDSGTTRVGFTLASH